MDKLSDTYQLNYSYRFFINVLGFGEVLFETLKLLLKESVTEVLALSLYQLSGGYERS